MKRFLNGLSPVWKLFLAVAGCVGIYYSCRGFPKNPLMTFQYYTIQSNLLCVILFFYLAFRGNASRSRFLSLAKNTVTMGIMATFLVYHIFLSQGNEGFDLGNFLTHLLVPLMTLADYFLFDVKGLTRVSDLIVWTLFPFYYLLFLFIWYTSGFFPRAADGKLLIPYFFLNYQQIGWGGVAVWSVVGVLLFGTAGFLFFTIDHRIAAKKRH